jgi:hypothetical protein
VPISQYWKELRNVGFEMQDCHGILVCLIECARVDSPSYPVERISRDVGVAGEQVVWFRVKQRSEIHRQMTVHDGKPLCADREFAAPAQAGRAMFAGSVFKIWDLVAVSVAKYEEKRKNSTFGDDGRAVDIAAMNNYLGTLGTKQLHGIPCAEKLVVSVRKNANDHGSSPRRSGKGMANAVLSDAGNAQATIVPKKGGWEHPRTP